MLLAARRICTLFRPLTPQRAMPILHPSRDLALARTCSLLHLAARCCLLCRQELSLLTWPAARSLTAPRCSRRWRAAAWAARASTSGGKVTGPQTPYLAVPGTENGRQNRIHQPLVVLAGRSRWLAGCCGAPLPRRPVGASRPAGLRPHQTRERAGQRGQGRDSKGSLQSLTGRGRLSPRCGVYAAY